MAQINLYIDQLPDPGEQSRIAALWQAEQKAVAIEDYEAAERFSNERKALISQSNVKTGESSQNKD